jgi:NAD-dependent dihydropyrimidine dehydrogenase PreA subunit
MSEPFFPIIAADRCNSCGECVRVCPTGALALRSGLPILVSPDDCIYCADCEVHCPEGAISLPYEIVAEVRA